MQRALPWIVVLAGLALGLAWLTRGGDARRATEERSAASLGEDSARLEPALELAPAAALDPLPAARVPIASAEVKETVLDESSSLPPGLVDWAAQRTYFSGRVLDQDGQPVAGLVVVASPLEGDSYLRRTVADAASHGGSPERTQPDGRFSVRGSKEGRWSVSADGPDVLEPARIVLTADLDPTSDLELHVRLAPELVGRVRWSDGVPVELFRVYARGERGEIEAEGRNGRFAVRVIGERVRLEVRARGYGVSGDAVLQDVDPAQGEVEVVLVRMPRVTAHGRVVDPEGRPIERFDLVGWKADERVEKVLGSAREGGRFGLRGLTPGEWHIVCTAQGFLAGELVVRAGVSDLEGLVFELGPEGEVTGLVLDPSGAPLAGAGISLGSQLSVLTPTSLTAADGTFRVAATASPLWVQAALAGRTSASERVLLVPGQRVGGIVLQLREHATLRGRLRTQSGSVAGNLLVDLTADDGSTRAANVDDDGRFFVDRLPIGGLQLRTHIAERFFVASASLVAGDNDLDIVLFPEDLAQGYAGAEGD